MPIVFFSYAQSNIDRYLEDFFKDLCTEIALYTEWEAEDDRISFRDQNNLRVMENWKSHIDGALQSSSVLVCITTVAYFAHPFPGREYYRFDQRRRQSLKPGDEPPPVILPVIWVPVPSGLPKEMLGMQLVPAGVVDKYKKDGLRSLKRFDTPAYDQCVTAFAKAIVDAWGKYKIPPLTDIKEFSDIPNTFAKGDWQEAAGPNGWLPGPEVANFVFAAGTRQDFPKPEGRYGEKPSEWRPYLPPEPETIFDHAKRAAKTFKFREIPVDKELGTELMAAKDRKNLTVLFADPKGLASPSLAAAGALEKAWWEGAAVIFPVDDPVMKWENPTLREVVKPVFPVISQLQSPNIQAISNGKELQSGLQMMLTDLHTKVKDSETEKKPKTDSAPAALSAAAGGA